MSTSPAGYSGTPLWKKLGIREGMTVLAINPPRNYRKLLSGLPKGVTFVCRGRATDPSSCISS